MDVIRKPNRPTLSGLRAILCLLACLVALPGALYASEEGYLGIRLEGGSGHIGQMDGSDEEIFIFDSPPSVGDVDPDGPAGNLLEVGDLILKVNGHDITSMKSLPALYHCRAGDVLRLVVERAGRKVRIPRIRIPAKTGEEGYFRKHDVIDLSSVGSSSSLSSSTSSLFVRDSGELEGADMWLGMGLSIKGTVWSLETDKRMNYDFDDPPGIYGVDLNGPADRAGLRRGDILTHIEGKRLNTHAGSELFTMIVVGEPVTFRYERDGVSGEATLVPERSRSGNTRVIDLRTADAGEQHLRYAGSLGDTDIEVRGVGEVEVTVDKGSNEIIIITSDFTVRLTQN
ncbi:MAG: PDZ domain-containing protein [bacterium]|nr:PDZ domain-containing protein [bacterium]